MNQFAWLAFVATPLLVIGVAYFIVLQHERTADHRPPAGKWLRLRLIFPGSVILAVSAGAFAVSAAAHLAETGQPSPMPSDPQTVQSIVPLGLQAGPDLRSYAFGCCDYWSETMESSVDLLGTLPRDLGIARESVSSSLNSEAPTPLGNAAVDPASFSTGAIAPPSHSITGSK